jgi:hypothetical protein
MAGEVVGSWIALSDIKGSTETRSYAAAAYYVPISNCSNLVVVTGAEATRIVSTKEDNLIVATAVEILLDGELRSVAVKSGGEVISCGR